MVLGIESSCDETAAAVVEGGTRVRSSVVASQFELHAEYGGVVPEIASRAHTERMLPVVRAALEQAGVGFDDLDAVAVGHRPGLIGSLLVGVSAAKAIAWARGLPLIGVDHVHAHLHAGLLEHGGVARDANDTEGVFPALGLVVSGGHTSIYFVRAPGDMQRLGGTIDDAVGEAFDKVATILGLPQPGGPAIDALAQRAGADDRAFDFPVSRLSKESLDFSFSGLKTSVLYEVRGRPPAPTIPGKAPPKRPPPAPPMTDDRRRDIAAGFQRAVCRAITLKLGRACDALEATELAMCVRSLLVGGGVSANSRVRAELGAFAEDRGVALVLPPLAYCVDNAAMLAGLGGVLLAKGHRDSLDLRAAPTTSSGRGHGRGPGQAVGGKRA